MVYMSQPRYCRNPECPNAWNHTANWFWRDGSYNTAAHGVVLRFRCKKCGKCLSEQTESMHYYAKRRLKLDKIWERIRGGASLRDIARFSGCSRSAIANAVKRLGRQAIACHCALLSGADAYSHFVFDGLVSAVASRDYTAHITTLVEASTEMVLAITHCITERGGKKTKAQARRIAERAKHWRAKLRALTDAISLLVSEIPRFGSLLKGIHLNTDEFPLYPIALVQDLALGWWAAHHRLQVTTTPGSAPRTIANPLFPVNYVDRMIRHRVKEHTRESIAIGRNSTMQMYRMWIFAWDHNVGQPHRVKPAHDVCRAQKAGISEKLIASLEREFYTRRRSVRDILVPESMRQVWLGLLDTPPLRWRAERPEQQFRIPNYAKLDLSFAVPQAA